MRINELTLNTLQGAIRPSVIGAIFENNVDRVFTELEKIIGLKSDAFQGNIYTQRGEECEGCALEYLKENYPNDCFLRDISFYSKIDDIHGTADYITRKYVIENKCISSKTSIIKYIKKFPLAYFGQLLTYCYYFQKSGMLLMWYLPLKYKIAELDLNKIPCFSVNAYNELTKEVFKDLSKMMLAYAEKNEPFLIRCTINYNNAKSIYISFKQKIENFKFHSAKKMMPSNYTIFKKEIDDLLNKYETVVTPVQIFTRSKGKIKSKNRNLQDIILNI